MTWVASETTVFADRTRAQVVADTDFGSGSMADKVKRARFIAVAPCAVTLITQLRRDMDSPHTDDAVRAVRMAAMDAIIARAGGK